MSADGSSAAGEKCQAEDDSVRGGSSGGAGNRLSEAQSRQEYSYYSGGFPILEATSSSFSWSSRTLANSRSASGALPMAWYRRPRRKWASGRGGASLIGGWRGGMGSG